MLPSENAAMMMKATVLAYIDPDGTRAPRGSTMTRMTAKTNNHGKTRGADGSFPVYILIMMKCEMVGKMI